MLTRRDNVIASELSVGSGFLCLGEVIDAIQKSNLARERNRECVGEDAWWGEEKQEDPSTRSGGKRGVGTGYMGKFVNGWI